VDDCKKNEQKRNQGFIPIYKTLFNFMDIIKQLKKSANTTYL